MQTVDESSYVGPSEALVRKISGDKKEPEWMLELRLAALKLWKESPMPGWGPDLSGLDLKNMTYYVDPEVKETSDWKELPKEITDTFEKLGIPRAEREYLGGVGAQYDSGVVYHSIQKKLSDQGVVFENMDVALQKYPELVKEHFMTKCVPAKDHKFTMLHAAVWSGGTFIYVPKGVKVALPLQAYFRMNKARSAQFEHTLIIADEGSEVTYIEGCSAPQYTESSLHAGCVELWVKKNARIKYISVENWSRNTYNLNTKKALVFEDGLVEWVNGTFSRVMPPREDITRGAVAYTPSIAHRSSEGESARPVVHAFFDQDTRGEAEAVLAEVAAAKPGESTAILVRARSHLTEVVTRLRARGIPFQAIEIDPLGERPVVQDLMALTFALLHLADRIAWLAVLRAPWCALGLAKLDAIAGAEHKATIWDLLQRPGLDEKTARVVTILGEALDLRGRVPLRTLVEGTWIRLGGPACLRGASDLSDASAYFDLLDGVEQAGDLADFGLLRDQVAELFAQPSAEADGRLQVMTIHRAKGLEFDTVIVPGLGQPGRKDDEQLLIWQEQEGELLLAAMSATGSGCSGRARRSTTYRSSASGTLTATINLKQRRLSPRRSPAGPNPKPCCRQPKLLVAIHNASGGSGA